MVRRLVIRRIILSKTTSAANVILDLHVKGTAPASITPYLCLLTNVETPTEPSGNAYAPVALTGSNFANNASSKTIANTAQIVFPTASGGSWGEIVGIAIKNGSSGSNYLRTSYLAPSSYFAFTGKASDDYITAPGHTFTNGQKVVFLTIDDSVLPTGLTQGTIYYVIGVSGNTFQVSATSGGSAINISADGAGKVTRIIPLTVADNFRPTFDVGTLVFKEN